MGSRILVTILAALLVGVIHFIAGLKGNGATILLSGVLMGLLPYGIWRLRGMADDSPLDLYLPLLAGIFGIASGGILRWAIQTAGDSANTAAMKSITPVTFDIWAVLLGLLSSAIVLLWRMQSRRVRCHCCHRVVGSEWQKCPRCDNATCSNCWSVDSYRCVDCERIRTPLLELENAEWWTERLGRKESVGRCIRCRREASERDLRRCRQCPRAMCTHCWDMENGRCIGCNYVIEGLPASLLKCHEQG